MSRFGFAVLVTTLGTLAPVLPLRAQRTLSVQCPFDLIAIPCSSDAECSRLYREHLCREHPDKCPGGDASRPNPARAPVLGLLAGAATGFAIGGAAEMGKTDEQKQADKEAGKPSAAVAGTAIGAGVGLMMGLGIKAMSKFDVRGSGPWMTRHIRSSNNPMTGRVYIGARW